MATMDLEQRIRQVCAPHRQAVSVYLFGSAGRGEEHPDDIDVAVLFAERQPSVVMNLPFALGAELERELRRPVDVVDLHRASPDLIHRILRDGRLILDRDPSRRIAFEVKARNEYFDLEPVRREYRHGPRTRR